MKEIIKFASFLLLVATCFCGCANNENSLHVKGLSQTELDNLNKDLKQYSGFNSIKQKEIREKVIQEVGFQRDKFETKLKNRDANLNSINLIVGATGSGKSCLFNFLNGVPLIIRDINGKARLEIDEKKLENLPKSEREKIDIASISHGFVSETTIPNFSKTPKSDTLYVDCAGEFDNKDILQSIINSYLKCDLAEKADKIKISIAVNYSEITDNRATCFNLFLKQINSFIKDWSLFEKFGAISLIATNVPNDLNNPIMSIKNDLLEIARDVKDLGNFRNILEGIVDRDAIAVFLKPEPVILNLEDIKNSKSKKPLLGIANNEVYNPDDIGKVDNIFSIIENRTKFIGKEQCKEEIFAHNLQRDAQKVIEQVCSHLANDAKEALMSVIKVKLPNGNKDNLIKWIEILDSFNSNYTDENLDKLISELHLLEIVNGLDLYKDLKKELKEFSKISNVDLIAKVWEVQKDLRVMIDQNLKQIAEGEKEKAEKSRDEALVAKSRAEDETKRAKEKADDMEEKAKESANRVFSLEKQLLEEKAKEKKESSQLAAMLGVVGLVLGGPIGGELGKITGTIIDKEIIDKR